MSRSSLARSIGSAGAAVFALASAWVAVDHWLSPPEFLFPRISSILFAVINPNTNFFIHLLSTAEAATFGLALSAFIASLAILAVIFVPAMRPGLYGVGLSVKATPIVAIAPLLIIWLGTGLLSKVAAAAIPCFFPLLVSSLESIERTPSSRVDVARSFGASRWEVFTKIELPSAAPWIFSGIRIAAPLSIVGAIVGELVGARVGLGYLIIRSSYQLQTDVVFAAIFGAAALAGTMVAAVYILESAVVGHSNSSNVLEGS